MYIAPLPNLSKREYFQMENIEKITTINDDGDDDEQKKTLESDDPVMAMAWNKPIFFAQRMHVLKRPKELAAHRGELLFWVTRAHSLHDFYVSMPWQKTNYLPHILVDIYKSTLSWRIFYENKMLWLPTVDSKRMMIMIFVSRIFSLLTYYKQSYKHSSFHFPMFMYC